MSDYISRQAAIDSIWDGTNYDIYTKEVKEHLEELPTADVVEVVRCKDCKWFNNIGCAIKIVDDSDKPKDNDYCSFGERADECMKEKNHER